MNQIRFQNQNRQLKTVRSQMSSTYLMMKMKNHFKLKIRMFKKEDRGISQYLQPNKTPKIKYF